MAGRLARAQPLLRRLCTRVGDASPSPGPEWEVVVGLEFHCQVSVTEKLFSPAAPFAPGLAPNTAVAPFDAAMPGTLPVLNRQCVDAAVRLGFALGGDVQRHSYFERKHYLYPDLPHGYQITQQAAPIVRGGSLWLLPEDAAGEGVQSSGEAAAPSRGPRRLPVERVQLEMDTGKLSYGDGGGLPAVDLNRAGCALLEVVTAPALRSGAEAAAAVRALQRLLRHTRVSTAALEDGSLRCDVNISVRCTAQALEGGRVEVKNLNSIRSVARAVDWEAARHVALLSKGMPVPRQTLGFDAASGATFPQRDKETALDYRFIPEPDVPPIVLEEGYLAALRSTVPELPDVAAARLQHDHGVPPAAALMLTQTPAMLAYFDAAAAACSASQPPVPARILANWLVGDFVRAARQAGVDPLAPPPAASPQRLAQLLALLAGGATTGPRAKTALAAMMGGDESPVHTLCGGGGDDDNAGLEALCADILGANPNKVQQFLAGRDNMMGFFMGQVRVRGSPGAVPHCPDTPVPSNAQLMKKTNGGADPIAGTSTFKRLLARQGSSS